MATDAIAIHQAAAEARRWLTPRRLLGLLYGLPVLGLVFLVIVRVGPQADAVLALLLLGGPWMLALFLAFRLLRRAAGGRLVGALTWLGFLAVLGAIGLLGAEPGRAAAQISELFLALSAALVLPFAAAAVPLLGATRRGSAARRWLASSYALTAALVAAPALLGLALALGEPGTYHENPFRYLDFVLLSVAAAAVVLYLPLCLAAPWCRRAMEELFPAALVTPAAAHAALRRRLAKAMDIRGEERPSPGTSRLLGLSGRIAVRAELALSPAPACVALECRIPGLPEGFSVRARAAGEPPGVRLADPVLAGALRISGASEPQAETLLGGLHAELLGLIAGHAGARIEGGWLTVPLPSPADRAAARPDERLRQAASLAAILAERARPAGGPAAPGERP